MAGFRDLGLTLVTTILKGTLCTSVTFDLENMFCILLGELQAHFKQLLLELFVEGNLASIHGAGYEANCQVSVVRKRKIQEVKPGKAKILLLQS